MISIYCIEDINNIKYIGSTSQTLNARMSAHRSHKKRGKNDCSSSKLDLEHSVIYEIERCHQNERMERERYWINEIECVNEQKLTYNQEEYYQRNKDRLRQQKREYYQRMRICKFIKMLEEY